MEIVGLLIAGIMLIAAEAFVPGGILGLCGGACMLAATIVTYNTYGIMPAVMVGGGSAITAGVMLFLQFKLLSKTSYGKKIFLRTDIGKGTGLGENTSFIGQTGICETALSPEGSVKIDNQIYTAHSEDGFLNKGEPVEIVKQANSKLYVRKKAP